MELQISIHFVDGRTSHSRQARSHAARVAKSRRRNNIHHSSITNLADSAPKQDRTKRSDISKRVYANASRMAAAELLEDTETADPDDGTLVNTVQLVPRMLSPMLGALSVSSTAPSTSLHGIQYMTQIFWPNFHMHGDDSLFPLLQAYCDQPLFHHYLNYTAAVHSAILSNTVTRSATVKRLVHYQSQVIRLLRGIVGMSDLSTASPDRVPEWAITLVIALASMDYQQCLTSSTLEEFLFVPHMPTADWLNIFGRIRPQDTHLAAMHTLIDSIGGFQSLQFSGLRGRVAWADLVQASMNGRRPVIPCIWKETTSMAPLRTQSAATAVHNFASLPGGLPRALLDALQQLAALDALLSLSDLRSLHNDAICRLKALRNIVQYDMLSLPPWPHLPPPRRQSSSPALYETVRITALIYCQAVVFPLPPHSDWHLRLLGELHDVLEPSGIQWHDDDDDNAAAAAVLRDLLVWALCVAGIAACGTPFETSFSQAFRRAVEMRALRGKDDIRAVVRRFVWQDVSCGRGLDVVCARWLGW